MVSHSQGASSYCVRGRERDARGHAVSASIRLGAALLCLLGVFLMASTAFGADSGTCPSPTVYTGAGTSGDPLSIGTPGQLQKLRDTSADWSKVVRLTADIDMDGCVWGSSFGPTPVNFTGTFDGGGHVIRGLDIAVADGSYAGFIGYLGSGGTIKDLGFTGDVSGARTTTSSTAGVYVGGLVAFTYSSTNILRAWASGTVTGTATATRSGFSPMDSATANVTIGGLIGNSQGTVADVYATGSVIGTATSTGTGLASAYSTVTVGGLIGNLALGSLANAYSAGVPSGTANATSTNSVTRTTRIGGLAGTSSLAASTARWDLGAWPGSGSGSGTSVGTGVTNADMSNFATFGPAGANWNISNGYSAGSTWGMCPAWDGGRPFLTAFLTSAQCVLRPATPDRPAAVAGDGKATITVAAGAGAGEAPVTFLVTAVEDNSKQCTVTVPATSCEITGLTNGTSYTFTATATNIGGTSAASSPSLAITPRIPGGDAVTTASAASSTGSVPLRLRTTATTTSTAIVTTFTATGPGVVTYVGTTSPGRRGLRAAKLTVCNTRQAISAAGEVRVTCHLSSSARRLRAQQALVISLTTTFTPTNGTPMVSTKSARLARTPVAKGPTSADAKPSNVTG